MLTAWAWAGMAGGCIDAERAGSMVGAGPASDAVAVGQLPRRRQDLGTLELATPRSSVDGLGWHRRHLHLLQCLYR